RVRGVSPLLLFRFFASSLLAPALLGLVVGLLVAAGAGFGLTNLIWSLRELKSVVHLLPAHLVISDWTVWISLGLLAVVVAVALMGPSGCGKTTLLNILGGVDHATGGEILVGDQKLTSLSERELEKYRLHKVGFVFQFFNLIPTLTALENLELPMLIAGVEPAERKKRMDRLLQMVGLGDKGHKRPEELSGGEQQRVAVAL